MLQGIGYEFGSDDALVEVLENVQKETRKKMIAMKEACLRKAKDFSPKSNRGGFIRKFF